MPVREQLEAESTIVEVFQLELEPELKLKLRKLDF
jgi:hypothetical protein